MNYRVQTQLSHRKSLSFCEHPLIAAVAQDGEAVFAEVSTDLCLRLPLVAAQLLDDLVLLGLAGQELLQLDFQGRDQGVPLLPPALHLLLLLSQLARQRLLAERHSG